MRTYWLKTTTFRPLARHSFKSSSKRLHLPRGTVQSPCAAGSTRAGWLQICLEAAEHGEDVQVGDGRVVLQVVPELRRLPGDDLAVEACCSAEREQLRLSSDLCGEVRQHLGLGPPEEERPEETVEPAERAAESERSSMGITKRRRNAASPGRWPGSTKSEEALDVPHRVLDRRAGEAVRGAKRADTVASAW